MHFKSHLFLLGLICCSALFAAEPQNLFKNMTFASKDGKFPPEWTRGQFRQKTVLPVYAPNHAMLGGRDGAELPPIPAGSQPSAFVGLAQRIEFPEMKTPRRFVVRARLAGNNLSWGSVVAFSMDKENKTIFWKTIGYIRGNALPRVREFTAEVPEGAVNLEVSFRNSGTGILWVTDAQLFWDDSSIPPIADDKTATDNLVMNPTLADATPQVPPKGWKRFFYPGREAQGDIAFPNGKCTLTHLRGAFGFGAESAMTGAIAPMHTYPITAKYSVSDGGEFQISAVFRDVKGEQLAEQFSPVFNSTTEATVQWQATAPPKAHTMTLRWLNNAKGTVVVSAPTCKMGAEVQIEEPFPIRSRVTPAEWTPDWAGGKATFYTFRNTEVPLSIEISGDRTKLKKPEIYLEFPDELEVSCYSSYPTPEFYQDLPGEIVRKENGRTLLKLSNVKLFSILNKYFGSQRTVIAGIRGPKTVDKPYPMKIWIENDGKKGTIHEFDVRLLEDPKDIELPKSFYIGRWSALDSFPYKQEIFERFSTAQHRCGLRQATIPWGDNPHWLKYIDTLREKGWIISCPNADNYGGWKFPDYTPPRAIGTDGMPRAGRTCPEQLVDHPKTRETLRNIQNGYLQHMKAGDYTLLDYEPFETMEWCYCDYCRKKFAKRFNLATVPTTQEIVRNYSKEWVTFRCENTLAILRLNAEGLRERMPGMKVFDYDYVVDYSKPNGPLSQFSSVCKDPVMNDQVLDGHLQSYYHLFDMVGFRMIRINHARFKSAYIPMGAISGLNEGYLCKSEVLSPARTRMMILAAAVNGSSCYWFYRGTFDALYMQTFQTALHDIARLEKLPLWPRLADDEPSPKLDIAFRPYGTITLANGKIIHTPAWQDLAVAVQATEGTESLAAIFNYHEQPLFADIKSAAFKGSVVVEDALKNTILFNGTAEKLREGFLLRLAPRDTLFLRIRPATQKDGASTLNRDELEAAYKGLCSTNLNDAWNAKKANGFSIATENVDDRPGVKVSCPEGSFCVSLLNGGIQNWIHHGKERPGNWGRTHIWLPEALRDGSYPWTLEKTYIMASGAVVVLKAKANECEMTKRLIMHKDGKIQVSLAVKNLGQQPISLTPKFCHLLNSPLFFSSNDKPITLPLKNNTVVPSREGRHDGFGESEVRQVPGVGNGMYAKVNGTRVDCLFATTDVNRAMMHYFWRGDSGKQLTWEFIWLPVDIAPGKTNIFECLLSAY